VRDLGSKLKKGNRLSKPNFGPGPNRSRHDSTDELLIRYPQVCCSKVASESVGDAHGITESIFFQIYPMVKWR
jgi:hypothetical protein